MISINIYCLVFLLHIVCSHAGCVFALYFGNMLSRDVAPIDELLAALQREFGDSFSLMAAPSLASTSSRPALVRGESLTITPSSARVASTRSSGGG